MVAITMDIDRPDVKSCYVENPFDIGKEALEEQGYEIISLEENARLRRQEGVAHTVSVNGNYTREGILHLQKRGRFLVRNSPILQYAREATQANRNNLWFYSNSKEVKEAFEQSLTDSFKILENPRAIPTNRLGEEGLTAFAFGKEAKPYGEFLREQAKIEEMPVHLLTSIKDKPFATQLWFGCLGVRSGLDVNYRGLDCSNRVRGVRCAEGAARSAQKNPEVYSINDIQIVLKEKGLTGIEAILTEGLNKLRK